jgi:glucose/arabinose dehydrogenase
MRRRSTPRRLARAVCLLAATSTLAVGAAGCIAPPDWTVTTVVGGLEHPWDVGFAGNAMIFTERGGRISSYVGGVRRVMATPSDVRLLGESGMLGLAVDSQFSSNRYIYTCFASTLGTPDDVRLVRWTVNADFSALTNRTDIVTGMPMNTSSGRHSGCRPRMDPQGRIWVGTGDAASATVPQDPRSLGGKVLCVNRNGAGVPGNPGGALDPRIFSYGHRNIQGVAIRARDVLRVTVEHGTHRDDELNRMVPGNFGWDPHSPPSTGYDEGRPMTDLGKFPSAVPALWSSGDPTIAPSGATFLTGSQWGQWNDALVVALLKGRNLLAMKLDDGDGKLLDVGLGLSDRGRLRSVVQGPDGNLYVTTDNGGNNDAILRIVPG